MRYVIHYDIAAIVIYTFLQYLIYARKGFSKASNRIFSILVLVGLLSAISDVMSSYYISYPLSTSQMVLDFWNYTFLFFNNSMTYLFLIYLLYMTGLQQRMKTLQWVLISVPIACSYLALMTNPLTHGVFYYDAQMRYTHGVLIYLLYGIAFFNLMVAAFFVLRFRKALPREKVSAVLFCIVLCIIPIAIQMVYSNLLIQIFFQSIGLMGLLFSIENEDELKNPITGANNRFAFIRDVDLAFHTKTPLLVLTVKLFNFNYSNSTLGVQYMNHVLTDMAAWLDAQVKGAECYDFYNGHFAIIRHDTDRAQMLGIAERIRERFDLEWARDTLSVVFPAQICLLELPAEISTMEQLMLVIDVPVEESHSRSHIISSSALYSYQREVLIEQKIQEAIEKQSFEVYYQPIWDKNTGQIRSAEALVRLNDAELGFIPPDEFIPIAERNGMIMDIGTFVIEEACRFFTESHLKELGIDYLEINLSVVQCMNHHLPRIIQDILSKRGLKPHQINFEITESAAAGNKTALEKTVRELAGRGFALSLDDYGTGYSNYSYMFALPFKIIKIDKSILWSALDAKNNRGEESAMILLENTIRMLKQMQYRVVTEGVETEEQKELLLSLGCDYMQGYLFSKPLANDAFLEFVRGFNAAA